MPKIRYRPQFWSALSPVQYNHITYLKIPHFKGKKFAVSGFQLHSNKKLTLTKNIWQCFNKMKFNQFARKMLLLFLSEELAILGPSSPDSVFDKKFGNIFPKVLYVSFFKKGSQKKWIFGQNRTNFTKKDKNGKETEDVT